MTYKGFRILAKERHQASPPRGMRPEWTEYQVKAVNAAFGDGRRILFRDSSLEACKKFVDDHHASRGAGFMLWQRATLGWQ